jgi:hypothetical protein
MQVAEMQRQLTESLEAASAASPNGNGAASNGSDPAVSVGPPVGAAS